MLCPFTGGGFGCKGFQWPHTMLAAMAARGDRPAGAAQPDAAADVHLGGAPPADRADDGARRPQGRQADRHPPRDPAADRRRPPSSSSRAARPPARCSTPARTSTIPHRLVRVNVAPPTPMRAPGDCPGTFALESAMDELAYALGMDPVELRLTQPRGHGRRRGEALVEQAPQGVLRARRREVRLEEAQSQAGLDEGRRSAGRLGDGDRALSRQPPAGLGEDAALAGRPGARAGRHAGPRHRLLHDLHPGVGRRARAAGRAGHLRARRQRFSRSARSRAARTPPRASARRSSRPAAR